MNKFWTWFSNQMSWKNAYINISNRCNKLEKEIKELKSRIKNLSK